MCLFTDEDRVPCPPTSNTHRHPPTSHTHIHASHMYHTHHRHILHTTHTTRVPHKYIHHRPHTSHTYTPHMHATHIYTTHVHHMLHIHQTYTHNVHPEDGQAWLKFDLFTSTRRGHTESCGRCQALSESAGPDPVLSDLTWLVTTFGSLGRDFTAGQQRCNFWPGKAEL